MKKQILFLMLLIFFIGCSNNESSNKNPYIPNYSFSVDLNMNLPLYSTLKSPGNGIYYSNAGAKGIIVFNTGSGYNAFDAACPNQEISSCSTMTFKGINALCACDNKEYNLFTGQGDATYPMKQYRVQIISETLIRIYN
jgi:nitrite reductase/ring-hydroxylating ferredoxin subunit